MQPSITLPKLSPAILMIMFSTLIVQAPTSTLANSIKHLKMQTSVSSNFCILSFRLNNSWPRGYERKGTALTSMGSFDEAIETYKQGLAHDPNNAALQNGLKTAEEKKSSGGANPMMNQAYLQGMMKLISNPETKDFIQDPEFMQKVQMIMQNPASFQYFSSDPKIKKAFEVISSDIPADFDFENLMKGKNPGPSDYAPKK